MRLAQLAEERRRREAAAEAIVAAKQRELEFLEQEAWQEDEQGRTAPSAQQPQLQAGAWVAGEDLSLPSPLASPLSRTG